MQTATLAKILKINSLIDQQQLRLNQTTGIPSLSSFLHGEKNTRFPGQSDAINDVLEKRKNLLLEKNALLGDILFILHHAIRTFIESDLTEQEKVAVIKVLENNKLMIEKRRGVLQTLELIYRSLMIEPGSITLVDGEKEDPNSFRVVLDPQPSLSPQQSADLLVSWQQQLNTSEAAMDTILQLQKLPNETTAPE